MNKYVYENRYTAYIDILGFKELVRRENFEYIKEILDVLESERRKNYEKKGMSKSKLGVEISLFSDSLIMSYPETSNITKDDYLFYLIDDINMLQCDLAFKNVFLRGGIAKGELYHKKNICFGKAMLEAYQLEQSAIYPRIVLTEEVLKGAINNQLKKDRKYSDFNTFETEANDYCKILKKDIDGLWYTDFMNQLENFDEIESYYVMLETIKKKCNNILSNDSDEHIKIKYNWLNNKLIEIMKIKNLQI